jgi:hypothetical protein
MAQTYCGNNAQNPDLLAGNVVLGTPYGCMRKGIGRGLHMPYDPSFAGAYVPIDQRRYYCGKQPVAPAGYAGIGSLSQCIQKGVGIGKRQRAEQGSTPPQQTPTPPQQTPTPSPPTPTPPQQTPTPPPPTPTPPPPTPTPTQQTQTPPPPTPTPPPPTPTPPQQTPTPPPPTPTPPQQTPTPPQQTPTPPPQTPSPKRVFIHIILPILIFLFLVVGFFLYLYFTKSSIITSKDNNNIKYIDWSKFMAFYIPTATLVGITIFLFWRFWVIKLNLNPE